MWEYWDNASGRNPGVLNLRSVSNQLYLSKHIFGGLTMGGEGKNLPPPFMLRADFSFRLLVTNNEVGLFIKVMLPVDKSDRSGFSTHDERLGCACFPFVAHPFQ